MAKKRKKDKPVLFHGGASSLTAGSQVLPAAKLPGGLPSDYRNRFLYEHARPELVYLTSDLRLAKSYAGRWASRGQGEGGSLVRVEVKGPLLPDPDYRNDPDVCWCAQVAFVTEVIESDVHLDEDLVLAGFQYMWWDDDIEKMYTADGYPNPSAPARAVGVTQAHLRPLGRLAGPSAVVERVTQLSTRALQDPARARAFLEWTERHRPDDLPRARMALSQAQRGASP